MLSNLHIENIAIIEKTDVDFYDGFNVLTGETGAGKSIIIDSVALLTGAKSSKELIGKHADHAFVSAVFSALTKDQLKALDGLGVVPDDEGNLIISRRISKDGRSISKVNGIAVNLSVLKSAAPLLISIHGQHDGAGILDPSKHVNYLDEYCNAFPLIEQYRREYDSVKKLRDRVTELTDVKNKKDELEAVLKFKIDEIERARITDGEFEKLSAARTSAENSSLIKSSLYNSQQILSGEDGSVAGAVANAVSELLAVSQMLDGVSDVIKTLESVKAELDDASASVSELLSEHEENEYTPEYIDDRLYTIRPIIKKYGSESEALQKLADFKNELEELGDNESALEDALAQYHSALAGLEKAAERLSDHRKKAASVLSADIGAQLKELDMPGARFEISIKRNKTVRGGNKYTPNGFDDIEFLISANAGLEPRPLAKIASGGELSRIMLCLKSTLNDRTSDCSSLIYDEIDSGVSGSTAQKIGRKMKECSNDKQVFCITHLAQIAAMADHHYKVEKQNVGDHTVSTVRLLDRAQRREEIARIMGGVEITDQLLKTADELINNLK